MKKNAIIALAAGVAAVGSTVYFLLRRKNKLNKEEDQQPQESYHGNTHHLTNVFSNAKKHALHMN